MIALAVGVAIDPLRPRTSIRGAGPHRPRVHHPSYSRRAAHSTQATTTSKRDRISPRPGSASRSPQGGLPSNGGGARMARPEFPAAGWEGEVGFETWILTHVFSDACHHTTLVDAGTTVEELTTALLAQQGLVTSGPTDVTIAGYPGQHIEVTVPAEPRRLDMHERGDPVLARSRPGHVLRHVLHLRSRHDREDGHRRCRWTPLGGRRQDRSGSVPAGSAGASGCARIDPDRATDTVDRPPDTRLVAVTVLLTWSRNGPGRAMRLGPAWLGHAITLRPQISHRGVAVRGQ